MEYGPFFDGVTFWFDGTAKTVPFLSRGDVNIADGWAFMQIRLWMSHILQNFYVHRLLGPYEPFNLKPQYPNGLTLSENILLPATYTKTKTMVPSVRSNKVIIFVSLIFVH